MRWSSMTLLIKVFASLRWHTSFCAILNAMKLSILTIRQSTHLFLLVAAQERDAVPTPCNKHTLNLSCLSQRTNSYYREEKPCLF